MADTNLPINIENEPINVKYNELKRVGNSVYRSECPVCDGGILMMRRDPKTLKLENNDICLSCGQRVIYDDISHLV